MLAPFAPDAEWRAALKRAPRRFFIPDAALASADRWIDKRADPQAWAAAVADDSPIVTQIDDGDTPLTAETARRATEQTCACSAPSVVFAGLGALDLRAHHRVLEVGTGTGWTAGLLAARLGDAGVTSIEVDPALAATAVANLDRVGLSPRLVVGDGAAGWSDGAPFDRVHVTCGVRSVPGAWIEQTRPGGVIVLPLDAEFGTGLITRLDVLDDGTAIGRFVGEAWYMRMRTQRDVRAEWPWKNELDGEISTTRLDPHTIAPVHGGAVGVWLSARLRNVDALSWAPDSDGLIVHWLLESGPRAESWAAVDYRPGAARFEVEQYGPRRLWDEAEAAYLGWLRAGRPGLERLGITVTAGGDQRFWLDSPDRPIR
ncbi:methyltransferase domain-containing protein [Actinoallomurus sp. NPDC052274]|uniref:methyltransferase domain-containing protein n=1 Tax=Actinoallomurus sp. NPDC052274 TaxID=3155420 RepID=UPI003425A470